MTSSVRDVEDLAGTSSYDVVIIGAGCIGANIGRELSKFEKLKVLIVEKDADVSQGASKANSGIVHGGYDAKGKWKGRFEREGNELFDDLCRDLAVPFKRIGSLVLSFTERDDVELERLMENGKKNGLRNLEYWDREKILKEEPHVSVGVRRALHCPSAGIVNPYLFTIANCENAIENGVRLLLSTEVVSTTRSGSSWILSLKNTTSGQQYEIQSRKVVNCAGVFSDRFCHEPSGFEIKPRRGEYFLLSRDQGHMANRVLFQAPTPRWGKGVLVSPTVDGNLLVGPSASDIRDRTNKNTTFQELAYVAWAARRSVPHLDTREALRSFSGIRAKSSTGDFVLNEKDGFVDVAGIDSPGLTASPAIALQVVQFLNLPNGIKKTYKSVREPYDARTSARKKEELQYEHSDPELNIICRCETVTESTIVSSMQRGIKLCCTDSIKWRTRAGMGDCQGARCRPLVRKLLGKDLGISAEAIPQDVPTQDTHVRLSRQEIGRL